MAMATPTTTAMISRTTRSPSESISWTVVASAATAGTRAGSGDGERHLSAPPLIFPEVGRHDPGHVAAGAQPGEGGVIMVCGGHRAVSCLARTRQVDEVAEAQASIGPAQPDLARARAGAHRGYGGMCGQPCRRPHEANHCAGFRRAIPGLSGGPLRTERTCAAGPNAASGTVTNRGSVTVLV